MAPDNPQAPRPRDYHAKWPGNEIDCTNPEILKMHDDLCDALEKSGYDQTTVVNASVGIWAGMQVMKEHCAVAYEELEKESKATYDELEQANSLLTIYDKKSERQAFAEIRIELEAVKKERDEWKANHATLQRVYHMNKDAIQDLKQKNINLKESLDYELNRDVPQERDKLRLELEQVNQSYKYAGELIQGENQKLRTQLTVAREALETLSGIVGDNSYREVAKEALEKLGEK